MSLHKYKKNLEYSYTLGAYPTIDLLAKKPGVVSTVLFAVDSQKYPGVEATINLCRQKAISFDFSTRAIQRVASKENTLVVGVFKKYESPVTHGSNHVVLVNPSDFGNAGTIIRTMVGFGITNLVLIHPAVDIFDPMVVRSSMGALFDINFSYYPSFESYQADFPENNMYSFMVNSQTELSQVKFERPASFVFGNEGDGLDEQFSKITTPVKIPQTKDIDSLNLAVATGIALYEQYKQTKA